MTFSYKKACLITGATGFVGSRLAIKLVSYGYRVHIVVRENSKIDQIEEVGNKIILHCHDGSTESMVNIVKESMPEIVFHLASIFISEHQENDVEPLIESNLLFGTQLLEAMNLAGVKKIINTGTSWQHYNGAEYNPVNLYAATKQAFESVIKYYVEACGFQVITLELFDTYGRNDPRKKIINLLMSAAKTGNKLKMSPGEQMIDLVHIDDVVNAYIRASLMLFKQKNLYNMSFSVGTGNPIKLKELVRVMEKITKIKINVEWGSREYRKREVMIVDNSLDNIISSEGAVKLDDGISEIWEST